MTSAIKHRIAQLQQGIVPKGYKKGTIGIVPEEWRSISFSTLFTSTNRYTDDLSRYPLYSLTIEDGITKKTDRYERSHLVKKENSYKVVQPNDYAYNPMNIRFGAVARHKGNMPVAVSGYYDIFNVIHESDRAFMDCFLTCDSMITYYNKVSTGSLIEKQRVHFSDFMEFSIELPPIEERKEIAKILAAQDRVIELLNRKIEQLKLLKKYYLRKMFPQHAKTVPEVRFPGFAGAWERKRLDDVFSEHTEKGHPELPALTIVQGGGTIKRDESERKLHYDKNYLSNYKVVDKGDFIVHLRSFEGGLEVATTRGLISPAYNVFRGKAIDPRFYYAYFRSPEFIHGDLTPHVYGIRDGRSIDIDGLKSIRIPYAPLAEQKAVGNFIATVDNQIALHQRKHDEEVLKKKALMQLLLTGIVRVRGVESGVGKQLPADRNLLASGKQIRKERAKCRRIYK
jgi:type I restriction enzyme S subunit